MLSVKLYEEIEATVTKHPCLQCYFPSPNSKIWICKGCPNHLSVRVRV